MSTTTSPTSTVAASRRRSPWLGPQGLAAVLVLVVTAGWRGVLLEGSYFNQDDYYLTSRALAQTTWSWSYLMEPVAGHVMPLQHATHWLVGHHLPFDWQSVAFLILLLQLTCGIIAWHLLSHLLPDRWARVPLLALLMWAPLTLATTLWWSASMSLWPHLLSALVATLALVRERLGRGRSWVNVPLCLVACLFGLAWHERSVLIAPLLVGLALALSPADGWRRIPEALRRFWVLWLAYAVGMVAYLWLHVEITTVSPGVATTRKYVELSIAYVFENALPGLVGGPWTAEVRGGAVVPPVWVSVLSGLLVLVVTIVLLRRGGADARWALLLLVVYLALDLALVLAGRVGFGRILGYDPRYASDLLLPAVLAVALALRNRGPDRSPDDGRDRGARGAGRTSLLRRAGGAVPALLVTGIVLVASSFGTAVLVPHFQNPDRPGVLDQRARRPRPGPLTGDRRRVRAHRGPPPAARGGGAGLQRLRAAARDPGLRPACDAAPDAQRHRPARAGEPPAAPADEAGPRPRLRLRGVGRASQGAVEGPDHGPLRGPHQLLHRHPHRHVGDRR